MIVIFSWSRKLLIIFLTNELYELLIRFYKILIRTKEIQIRSYELITRFYEILIRTNEIIIVWYTCIVYIQHKGTLIKRTKLFHRLRKKSYFFINVPYYL